MNTTIDAVICYNDAKPNIFVKLRQRGIFLSFVNNM